MLSNHGGTHRSQTACNEIINRKFLHTPIKNGSPPSLGILHHKNEKKNQALQSISRGLEAETQVELQDKFRKNG